MRSLLSILCLSWLASGAFADAPGPHNRAEATKTIGELRHIVTPRGVERLEAITIGGIQQWVSVRGLDRDNPILLMLHGGPGFVSMPMSWYFQRGWEEYFTVVQWDQRGAGKTYTSNDPAKVGPTLTFDRMVADTEEVIGWLRKEYGKRKIFVLGHSWGTALGLTIAQNHPDWLHAYIGMGQITNAMESERRGWQFAMSRAQRDHNDAAIRELQALAPYAQPGKPLELAALVVQRKWVAHYGGVFSGRASFDAESAAVRLSPEYSDADVASFGAGNQLSEQHLVASVLAMDFSKLTKLACPLIVFNGRDDYNVSSSVAAEWFARVQAPSKQLVWFEHSGHEMMNEEPGKLLLSLVRYARPIAERAGDVARP